MVPGLLSSPAFLIALTLSFLRILGSSCHLACRALPGRVLALWNTLGPAGLEGPLGDVWGSGQSLGCWGLWLHRELEPSVCISMSVKWGQSLFVNYEEIRLNHESG